MCPEKIDYAQLISCNLRPIFKVNFTASQLDKQLELGLTPTGSTLTFHWFKALLYFYVSPRRGIRFVLHAVSDLPLSLSLSLSLSLETPEYARICPEFQVIRGFSQKITADLLSYDKIHS